MSNMIINFSYKSVNCLSGITTEQSGHNAHLPKETDGLENA